MDLVLDQASVGLERATFVVQEGRLIGVHASNPFGAAAARLEGGELVLASAAGDVAYDNAVTVEADSVLTAGRCDVPAADTGPLTVTLGSTPDNGLRLNRGTLTLRSLDGYVLDVGGDVTGEGGVVVSEGEVVFSSAVEVGSLELRGGTLRTPHDPTFSNFTIVPSLSDSDYADVHSNNGVVVTSGPRHWLSGAPGVLVDGLGQQGADSPGESLFADGPIWVMLDLQDTVEVTQINTYSRHEWQNSGDGGRTPQVYSLYGSDAATAPNPYDLNAWNHIADVDTVQGSTGTKHPGDCGVSILSGPGPTGWDHDSPRVHSRFSRATRRRFVRLDAGGSGSFGAPRAADVLSGANHRPRTAGGCMDRRRF